MGRITASRKTLVADPRYGSLLASKFINCLMHDGKKSTAQRVFYDALDIVKEKINGRRADRGLHPGRRERQADDRSPLEARRRCRLSGADAGQPHRGSSRWPSAGFCWPSARRRAAPRTKSWPTNWSPPTTAKGPPIIARENVHRMADANKAFAHFAW